MKILDLCFAADVAYVLYITVAAGNDSCYMYYCTGAYWCIFIISHIIMQSISTLSWVGEPARTYPSCGIYDKA